MVAFSLRGRRLGSVVCGSWVAPAPALVSLLGRRAGGVVACWRPSSRAFSGAVVAVRFVSWGAAAAFALACVRRFGLSGSASPAVRRVAAGGFAVSVPVAAAPAVAAGWLGWVLGVCCGR